MMKRGKYLRKECLSSQVGIPGQNGFKVDECVRGKISMRRGGSYQAAGQIFSEKLEGRISIVVCCYFESRAKYSRKIRNVAYRCVCTVAT